MAENSTVEIELKDEKPSNVPLVPIDKRHSYTEEIRKWIAIHGRKSETPDNDSETNK